MPPPAVIPKPMLAVSPSAAPSSCRPSQSSGITRGSAAAAPSFLSAALLPEARMTKDARTEPSARVVMTSVTWTRILPSLHSVHSLRWPRSPSPALERPGRKPLTVLAASSSMLYLH